MIVIERCPMCLVETPEATFADNDRAVQLLELFEHLFRDFDIRSDFKLELRGPIAGRVFSEAFGILDRH